VTIQAIDWGLADTAAAAAEPGAAEADEGAAAPEGTQPPSAEASPIDGSQAAAPEETQTQTSEELVAAAASADRPPAAEEPQFIEVWRPGGRSDERRGPRRNARQHRRSDASSGDQAPEDGGAAAAPAERSDGRRGRRPERQDRPHRDRSDRSERKDRGPDRRRENGRLFASSQKGPRERKEPDPNSPFAKLAALKAQLEADAKEKR
jgi:ATP-dependent RNA helicase SUPV3L1/SUV3